MPSQEMDEWVGESSKIADNENSVEPGQNDISETLGEPIQEMSLSDTSYEEDVQVSVDVETVDIVKQAASGPSYFRTFRELGNKLATKLIKLAKKQPIAHKSGVGIVGVIICLIRLNHCVARWYWIPSTNVMNALIMNMDHGHALTKIL